MNTGVIYKATNIKNGKSYIGQAVSFSSNRPWGSKRRWQAHIKCAKSNKCECRFLENAINKYGEESFIIEDIYKCDVSELNYYEDYYIKYHNTLCPQGYNLMTGGGNGRKHNEETKEKMSLSRIGKIHSNETKEKISQSHKGRKVSKETLKNISNASKYRNMSSSNKERLELALEELNLTELPMYIYMSVDKRNNKNIDQIIVKNPNYPNKKFGKKDMKLTDKIQLAISYTQRSSV